MIRGRASILTDVIQIKSDLNRLKTELNYYPWDSNEPLVTVSKEDLTQVFSRAISGEISFVQLEDWANILEARDDIEFEDSQMENLIFELANPYLNGEINKTRLEEIVDELRFSKLK